MCTICAWSFCSTEYYVYDAVVNGEVTSIKVKRDSTAQNNLLKFLSKNEIGVYFGMNKDSKGYITTLTSKTPSDVAVNEKTNTGASASTTNVVKVSGFNLWTGVKRESNGGNVSFKYNQRTDKYDMSMAANSKALITYYDGEDLSIASRLVSDKYDDAIVVTDDGDIIAICVLDKELKSDGTTDFVH